MCISAVGGGSRNVGGRELKAGQDLEVRVVLTSKED